jgi:pentatricopeptide repeat protein
MVAAAALRRLHSSRRLRLAYAAAAYVSYGSTRAAVAGPWVERAQDLNRRIAELAAAGRVCEARRLFDGTPDQDVVAWTAMVSAYARQGMLRDARALFDRPDARRNVVTWTTLFSDYARRVNEAEALFQRMPERNVVSWNTMLEAYVAAGRVGDACVLFGSMPVRDGASFTMILINHLKKITIQ